MGSIVMVVERGGRREATESRRGGGKQKRGKIASIKRLELELLGLLPGVVGVAEVAVRGGLEVLGLLQAKLLDDDTGAEIPVVADDLDELSVSLLAGAVGVDVDGEGLGNTDGVRELDEDAAGEASSDERLGWRGISFRTDDG